MKLNNRHILVLIIAATLVITSLACGSTGPTVSTPTTAGEKPTDEKPANVPTESADAKPTEAPLPTATEIPLPTATEIPLPTATVPLGSARSNPAPVGSSVTADDMSFVVVKFIRQADAIIKKGNMFNADPEAGQEYVLVGITITCTKSSDGKCSYSTYNLSLLGSKGVKREAAFVSGVEGTLEGNEFYGGASVSGLIPYLVDKDETDILLVYEPFLGDAFYLSLPEPTPLE